MSTESNRIVTTDDLARERNRLAADRTLLAWLRTSLALIGFGFAIAQGFEYVEADLIGDTGSETHPKSRAFQFGISFMILGVLGAVAGIAQYLRVLKETRITDPEFREPWPYAVVMATLLVIIGTFGILAVLF